MNKTARAGQNVWGHANDWGEVDGFVTAETMPKGDGWFAHYPSSRVRGDSYTPYAGRTEWEREANAAMARAANSNFRRQGSY